MSAGDHVQPKQLAMFMHPEELKGMADLGETEDPQDWRDANGAYYAAPQAIDNMWARKLKEAKSARGGMLGHGAGVHASVAREGVKNPVSVRDDSLVDGYHLVAAAHDLGHQFVPVLHGEFDVKAYPSYRSDV